MNPQLPAPSLDWCLFLDVDGTLIELNDTPSRSDADSQVKVLLSDVAESLDGALALVSGRTLRSLDELFAPLKLPAAGQHGVERRKADGTMQGASFVDAQLDRARAAVKRLVQSHPGTLAEDKERIIALHFRLVPHLETAMRQAMIDIAKPLGNNYHIQNGNMVVEIKPRGFNKATAIKAFMQEPPFHGRRPVFAGDDLTDQDGFAVVEALHGISIGVGSRVQGQFQVQNVAALRGWLQEIADLRDSQRT